MWNLWYGCHKISAGRQHCYVYRGDAKRGIDSSVVTRTKSFDLPVRKKRTGEYKIPSGTELMTCFTSDFFVEDADNWRPEAWRMISERKDLKFLMITKRIHRLQQCIQEDWGKGYDHVTICCTVENQEQADRRLPIYQMAPVKHKIIICEPLLGPVDLSPYLDETIEQVVVGGESGNDARVCSYDWVLDIQRVCVERNISFWFKQTGTHLIKDGQLYKVNRLYQHAQARKANINYTATGQDLISG